jgi:hypothetical protein
MQWLEAVTNGAPWQSVGKVMLDEVESPSPLWLTRRPLLSKLTSRGQGSVASSNSGVKPTVRPTAYLDMILLLSHYALIFPKDRPQIPSMDLLLATSH